jgi:hypothetical protein
MYAKSNNNPKEKHKSKLLIGEKNRWKGKGKDTRSGWKETIRSTRTATQSFFVCRIDITLSLFSFFTFVPFFELFLTESELFSYFFSDT